MSCVKCRGALFRFFFFLRKPFLFVLSSFVPAIGSVFLAVAMAFQPLLILLSVRGPAGTAPFDSCGHRQETSAPNLQIGSLPTPVRLRARAVSNPPGQLSSDFGLPFAAQAKARLLPCSSPVLRVLPGRCASATGPLPVAGQWPRSPFSERLCWSWDGKEPAAIFL